MRQSVQLLSLFWPMKGWYLIKVSQAQNSRYVSQEFSVNPHTARAVHSDRNFFQVKLVYSRCLRVQCVENLQFEIPLISIALRITFINMDHFSNKFLEDGRTIPWYFPNETINGCPGGRSRVVTKSKGTALGTLITSRVETFARPLISPSIRKASDISWHEDFNRNSNSRFLFR